MEILFVAVFPYPVNIEHSIVNEKWPRSRIISHVNFTVSFHFVPGTLPSVNVKPTDLLKVFCDHTNLT